jgi:hypothetical protein
MYRTSGVHGYIKFRQCTIHGHDSSRLLNGRPHISRSELQIPRSRQLHAGMSNWLRMPVCNSRIQLHTRRNGKSGSYQLNTHNCQVYGQSFKLAHLTTILWMLLTEMVLINAKIGITSIALSTRSNTTTGKITTSELTSTNTKKAN